MCGVEASGDGLFSNTRLEERVPLDHPLRATLPRANFSGGIGGHQRPEFPRKLAHPCVCWNNRVFSGISLTLP